MRVETLMGLERFEDCHDCRPYDSFEWAEDSFEWAEGSSEWADWPKVKFATPYLLIVDSEIRGTTPPS